MKKMVLMFVGLGVLAVAYFYMEGMIGKERIEPGHISLVPKAFSDGKPVAVVKRLLPQNESLVGTVLSKQTTNVSAKAAAHVQKLHVSPGDLVTKGELLATLDDRELKAKLQQVRSQKTAAEAQLAQAETNFKRQENLREKGATTDATFEAAETGLKQARAQVAALDEAIREISIMEDFTLVTAPYAGVIVEKLTEVGSLVAPGMPLFVLQDPGRLRLEVSVPSRLEAKVNVGDEYRITIDGTGEALTGTVEEVIPAADPRTRSFTVRLALPEREGLRPGQFGRMLIPVGQEEVILVPTRGISEVGQLNLVYVKKDDGFVARMVRLGHQEELEESMVRVLAGLTPGEQVMIPNAEGGVQ